MEIEYSREFLGDLLRKMDGASGSTLYELGDTYDDVATIVHPDSPRFADVGYRGIKAFLERTEGHRDRTPIGEHRGRETKPLFDSLGDQIRAVITAGSPGGATDPRLHQVRAATGLNEAIPSDGGFLIEPTYSRKILENVWNNNEILKRIQKYTLGGNSNSMKIPGFDETSRATGSRYGGVQSYWTAEAGTYQATTPKFRMIELNLNKLIELDYKPDLIVHLEQTFPFRKKGMIDEMINELLKNKYDSIIACRKEQNYILQKNKENSFSRIDEGNIPRIYKENPIIFLRGLCLVSFPDSIKNSEDLMGERIGLYNIDNPINSIEIRDKPTMKDIYSILEKFKF